MRERSRIYLSSTFSDLEDYRAAVFNALAKAGLDVGRMEAYTAADERPVDLCLRDVSASDIYIGLFAWRYGFEPPIEHDNPEKRSITELEYRRAEREGLLKLIFLTDPSMHSHWPGHFKDTGSQAEKIAQMRRELETEKTVSFFRSPDELATLVLAAILRAGAGRRPFNVPPMLGHVPRAKPTSEIIDSLGPSWRIMIQGDGGMGKSTLARSICHRPDVIEAFPGGILWAQLGEDEPELGRILSDLYVVASGAPPAVTGLDALTTALAEKLKGRRWLMVVDDVWRSEDLSPFLQLGAAGLIVTTRLRNLSTAHQAPDWREVDIEDMEPDEAARLLGQGLPEEPDTRDALRNLAVRLGCWPLLLSLANARLLEERKSVSTFEAIARVTRILEKRGVLGFDRRDSTARNGAIEKSVDAGLDFLGEHVREKAREISVFPEGAPLPVASLAQLWGMDAIDVEEDVVRPLDNVRILRWSRGAGTVSLHGLIRRALGARLADQAAVHRKLLDAWGDPRGLPDEYAWRWFAWHCSKANEKDRLRAALLDVEWLRAKLFATDVEAMVGDFDHVDDRGLDCIQRACRQAGHVLAADPSQLVGQLAARIPVDEPLRTEILKRSSSSPHAWLRPVTASLVADQSVRSLRSEHGLDEMTFSANAEWAAHVDGSFGGEPRDVIVWDLVRWRSIGPRFVTHARLNPFATALSDDGRWLLYADSIGGVHRLGPEGTPPWTGNAHGDLAIAQHLAISAHGQRALSACQHGRLVAWDIAQNRCEVIWDDVEDRVRAVALDATGNVAVVARSSGHIVMLELWPARTRSTFSVDGEPSALATSFEGNVIAVATRGQRVEIHCAEQPARALFVGGDPTALAVSPDHRAIAVGTENGTLEVWQIDGAMRTARFDHAHGQAVRHVRFARGGNRVLSADLVTIRESLATADYEAPVLDLVDSEVRVTRDGSYAVAICNDFMLCTWALKTGGLERMQPRPIPQGLRHRSHRRLHHLALAQLAPRFLSWTHDQVCVWDQTGGYVNGLSAFYVRNAAISPDGKRVMFLDNHDVVLWEPETGKRSALNVYEGDPPGWIAISPDGQLAISSGGARGVYVWELERFGRPLFNPIPSRDKPTEVSFVGANRAVVCTGDGSLFEVDLASPASMVELLGVQRPYLRLFYDAECSRLVSAGDGAVCLWDARSWQRVGEFDAASANVEQVSHASERALLIAIDGALRLMSLADGGTIATFHGDKRFTSAAGDPLLESIVARDEAGQLHFFRLELGAKAS